MYRALKTFSGKISMKKGDVREIDCKAIINDLLRAKYIEGMKPESKSTKKSK